MQNQRIKLLELFSIVFLSVFITGILYLIILTSTEHKIDLHTYTNSDTIELLLTEDLPLFEYTNLCKKTYDHWITLKQLKAINNKYYEKCKTKYIEYDNIEKKKDEILDLSY